MVFILLGQVRKGWPSFIEYEKVLLNFITTRKYYERDAAYLALIDSFIQVRQGVFYWLPNFSFGMIGFKQDTVSLQSLIET